MIATSRRLSRMGAGMMVVEIVVAVDKSRAVYTGESFCHGIVKAVNDQYARSRLSLRSDFQRAQRAR